MQHITEPAINAQGKHWVAICEGDSCKMHSSNMEW